MTDPPNTLATENAPAPPVDPAPEATHEAEAAVEPRTGRERSILELQSLLSILVIVLFAITFVVQAFRVPSESMENTLLAGDFLLADKVHFAGGGAWDRILPYGTVQRGDVIVFRYPVEPSTYFVKRVIGVPGDRIRLLDKAVYVNGAPLQESYVIHGFRDHDSYRDNFPGPRNFPGSVNERWRLDLQQYLNGAELVVPANRYFVMGDNRDRSSDSRYWGFVPRGNIVGRPLLIYLSVRGVEDAESAGDDKLIPSGQILPHFFQLARWDRMFRLVR